jgi:hypothetical protein
LGGFQVHVEHRHFGAFSGKPAAGRPANAAATAGDHNHFVFQTTHCFSPVKNLKNTVIPMASFTMNLVSTHHHTANPRHA